MFISAVLALIASGSPTVADTPATEKAVLNSSALCMLAAGKKGVDRASFSTPEWVADQTGSATYRHAVQPITIELPTDKDGVARICTVRALLASQAEQSALAADVSTLLRAKPLDQGASLVWVVQTKTGPRGVQLFLDKISDRPAVRLIGAAF